MIKSVHIGEKNGLTLIHIDCDLKATGIESIDVVCEPGKAKEAQDLVFKVMAGLSILDRFPKLAASMGDIFKATAKR